MEIWDLYDAERRLTGQKHQRGLPVPQGYYHLVIHLAIFNEKNQLLSQQRDAAKKSWANLWDISVGGSVLSGENSCAGLRRETAEELGIRLPERPYRPVLTVNGPHYFDDYYVLRMELELASLRLQAEEVQAVRWLDRQELEALCAAGSFVPYNPAFLHYLFDLGQGLASENFAKAAYSSQVQAAGPEDIRTS